MKIIGITGSSGSGKSTVCDIMQEEYDVKIINADKIAKRLSEKGTNYLNAIVEKFGDGILDENGKLNRYQLAEIIYNDNKKREELNKCTLPHIVKEIKNEISSEKDKNVIIIDAPLLFESKLNEICDIIIGVISKEKLQIERIIQRDHIDYEQAEKRVKAQKSNEFYINNCNEIVENNNDFSSIRITINNVAKKYNITKKLQ